MKSTAAGPANGGPVSSTPEGASGRKAGGAGEDASRPGIGVNRPANAVKPQAAAKAGQSGGAPVKSAGGKVTRQIPGKAGSSPDQPKTAIPAARSATVAVAGTAAKSATSVQGAAVAPPPVAPTARPARRKSRHFGVILCFLLIVLAPLAIAGWYLFERAADQYASTMGFAVRREEGASAAEVLGGVLDFGKASTSDTDILYEFIQSQGLVESVDRKLDLRLIFSRPGNDPAFTVAPDAPIEDLLRYWQRMVTIYYDAGTGLIETRVLAFTPQDAQAVSFAIFEESSEMINRLTKVAREDTTGYAREELKLAEERLRTARAALTEFRARTQLVDPNIDIQGQMGLLNNLQGQLAEALIELDMLNDNTREGDPRIRQAEQRISVIERRIGEERKKFGMGEGETADRAYATLVGEYETLIVDREFAEKTYLAALANYDAAQAEAQRKTRYLAAYAQPTLAESAEYPRRWMLLGLIGLFGGALWSVAVLVYYSVRDRR